MEEGRYGLNIRQLFDFYFFFAAIFACVLHHMITKPKILMWYFLSTRRGFQSTIMKKQVRYVRILWESSLVILLTIHTDIFLLWRRLLGISTLIEVNSLDLWGLKFNSSKKAVYPRKTFLEWSFSEFKRKLFSNDKIFCNSVVGLN